MDKSQVINNFWSSFNLPVYDENTVPDDAVPPYITYSESTGTMDNLIVLNASLWYRSASWTEISRKSEEIAKAISYNGKILKFDDGYLYLCQGSPFSQRMADPSDDMIRRIYININAEFLSAY